MAKLFKSKIWLTRKFQHDGLTKEQIAEICGVTPKTIYLELVKFGLVKNTRGKRR